MRTFIIAVLLVSICALLHCIQEQEILIDDGEHTVQDKQLLQLEQEVQLKQGNVRKLNKEEASLHYILGLSKEIQFEYEAAVREYKLAVSLDPNNATYTEALEALEAEIQELQTNEVNPGLDSL